MLTWIAEAVDVPSLIQLFFLTASSLVIVAATFPTVFGELFEYGARETSDSKKDARDKKASSVKTSSTNRSFANLIFSLKVPHDWFFHFYLLSILASGFWAYQLLAEGHVFSFVATYTTPRRSSMTVDQICLTWTLMTVQGTRRLYECLAFGRKSSSAMWIGHWALGLAFYSAMSIAVWIEGLPTLMIIKPIPDLTLRPPSLRTFIGLPIFILASGMQFDCHEYLASLQKYTLPVHPIFQVMICPHYFAECLIYLSLSIIAAPTGQSFNLTVFTVFIFVVINLGVTAKNTRIWYANKFGSDKVKDRWTMIPFIF